jgi:myo-inositol-1(or 4)-monophosphatase
MTYKMDSNKILEFLTRVTQEAGKRILTYSKGNLGVTLKDNRPGAIDIVTDADRASEDFILDAINREFPEHDILTEERSIELKGSPWLWLVDPLDGTVNFAHGYPMFSVSLALMESGVLVAGMVHDPLKKESFYAIKNSGAFLNGNPIHVSGAARLPESILSTGFPYDKAYSPDNNIAEFSRVLLRVQGIRRGGSAALDLAYVSCGRLDGFWEQKLKPWDMAAGMLLVQEAGGRVSDGSGGRTDPYTRFIVATNGIIHDLLLQAVKSDS